MLEINGQSFEMDMSDADFYEKFMAAAKIVDAELGKVLTEDEAENVPVYTEFIRNRCRAIETFLDTLFGDGSGVKACGDNNSYMKHYKAFDAVLAEVETQKTERIEMENITADRVKRASGNRAQRRAKK